MNKKDICEIFKALTLFFVLTVVSIVMIYSKFEEGIESFWQEQEEIKAVVNEIDFGKITKEENCKKTGDVFEKQQKSPSNFKEEKYISLSCGEGENKKNTKGHVADKFCLLKTDVNE